MSWGLVALQASKLLYEPLMLVALLERFFCGRCKCYADYLICLAFLPMPRANARESVTIKRSNVQSGSTPREARTLPSHAILQHPDELYPTFYT